MRSIIVRSIIVSAVEVLSKSFAAPKLPFFEAVAAEIQAALIAVLADALKERDELVSQVPAVEAPGKVVVGGEQVASCYAGRGWAWRPTG